MRINGLLRCGYALCEAAQHKYGIEAGRDKSCFPPEHNYLRNIVPSNLNEMAAGINRLADLLQEYDLFRDWPAWLTPSTPHYFQ